MIYTSENISQLRQLVNCHVSRRLVSEKQNVFCSATLRCPSYGLFAKLFSKKRRPSNPIEGCATLRRPSYGLSRVTCHGDPRFFYKIRAYRNNLCMWC